MISDAAKLIDKNPRTPAGFEASELIEPLPGRHFSGKSDKVKGTRLFRKRLASLHPSKKSTIKSTSDSPEMHSRWATKRLLEPLIPVENCAHVNKPIHEQFPIPCLHISNPTLNEANFIPSTPESDRKPGQSKAKFEVVSDQPINASVYASRIARGYRRPSQARRRPSLILGFTATDGATPSMPAKDAHMSSATVAVPRMNTDAVQGPVPRQSSTPQAEPASPLPAAPSQARCSAALPTLPVTIEGILQQEEDRALTDRHLPGVGRLRIRRRVIARTVEKPRVPLELLFLVFRLGPTVECVVTLRAWLVIAHAFGGNATARCGPAAPADDAAQAGSHCSGTTECGERRLRLWWRGAQFGIPRDPRCPPRPGTAIMKSSRNIHFISGLSEENSDGEPNNDENDKDGDSDNDNDNGNDVDKSTTI